MYEEEKTIIETNENAQEGNYGHPKPGKAITSMVLGICSVSVWEILYITSIPCIILGIIAVCMASSEQRNGSPRYYRFAKAGKITGLCGIIIAALYTIVMTALIVTGNYY